MEYQECGGEVFANLGPLRKSGVDPVVATASIYQAATNGTNQLRYTAGEDANVIIASRKALDNSTLLQSIKDRFGL